MSGIPFSLIMDQLPQAVLVIDQIGKIRFANVCFERYWSLDRDDLVGRSLSLFLDRPGEKVFYQALCRTLAEKTAWEGTLAFERPGQDARVFHTAITPVKDQVAVTAFFVLLRDVTQEKARSRQLNQARKMEAIGTLAGGIAHDFNNILAGIVGYAELVKEDLEQLDQALPKSQERLDNMISAAMRAKDLIHQILAFSRAGGEARHPVQVGLLVKEVVQLLRASLPSTIEIVLDLASKAQVLAEPTQIHQIMMNLCANARDAMLDTGGTLSITLKNAVASEGDRNNRKFVLLSVADTGPGIDPAIRHKIMEPFFTTKPQEKGTGMGLSVVHGIVSGLDGEIKIRQNHPAGTVFDIYLPFFAEADARGTEPEMTAPVRGNNEIIVFVDDESDLIAIAGDGLANLGYQVKGFEDSPSALAWFRENPGRADLLVTDITMPGLTGDRLASEVRVIQPGLPFFFTTGASERMDEHRARQMGAAGLLYKPVSLEAMARKIRSTLDTQGEERWQAS